MRRPFFPASLYFEFQVSKETRKKISFFPIYLPSFPSFMHGKEILPVTRSIYYPDISRSSSLYFCAMGIFIFILILPGCIAFPVTHCSGDIPGVLACDNSPHLCTDLPRLQHVETILIDGTRHEVLDASCLINIFPTLKVKK